MDATNNVGIIIGLILSVISIVFAFLQWKESRKQTFLSGKSPSSQKSAIGYFSGNPSPEQIKNHLNNSTPYLQKEISKSYTGVKVKWKLAFSSIHRVSGNTHRLHFFAKDSHNWSVIQVITKVDIRKYPIFRILEHEQIVTVEGVIESVDILSISLKNCSYEYLPESLHDTSL